MTAMTVSLQGFSKTISIHVTLIRVTSTLATAASTKQLQPEAVHAAAAIVVATVEVEAKAETIAMAVKSPIATTIVTAVTTAIEVDEAEVGDGGETKTKIATVTGMIVMLSQRNQDHGTTMISPPTTTIPIRKTPNSEPASTTAAIATTTTDRLDHAVVGDEVEDADVVIKIKVATKDLKMTSTKTSKILSVRATSTPTIAHRLGINADEEEMMVEAMEETKAAATDGRAVVDRVAVENGPQVKRSTTAKFQLGTMRLPA